MTATRPAPVSSRLFDYDPATRTFSQEASTLSDALGRCPPPSFRMRSARTGAVVVFQCIRVDRDREGDVRAWEYANNQHGVKATIWND